MDINDVVDRARESISVKQVFGEPVQQHGVTLVPVAKVRGGGGGGRGEKPEGKGTGSGSGFQISARPTGAYVLRGGNVTWKPALDASRIIMGWQLLVAFLSLSWLWARRQRLRASAPPRRLRRLARYGR